MRPALTSCVIVLIVEVPMCIFLALWGARRFAFWLSQSDVVSRIAEKMWKVCVLALSLPSVAPSANALTDDRLVLHILRHEYAAGSHPARNTSALVSVSVARIEHSLGATVGHRGE